MSETVNQEPATIEEPTTEERRFTQAELDKVVADRLARERQKYEGFSELKEKAAKFDELEAASKTELQKATEKAERLEKELTSLKKAEEVRTIKTKVATETGVPAGLLTGTTEEECKAQADAILNFAKPQSYPTLKDSGEVNNVGKPTTKQQFADWANQAFN
jgi:hypothetical protein